MYKHIQVEIWDFHRHDKFKVSKFKRETENDVLKFKIGIIFFIYIILVLSNKTGIFSHHVKTFDPICWEAPEFVQQLCIFT